MKHRFALVRSLLRIQPLGGVILLAGFALVAIGGERRAPAPKFSDSDVDGVFFEDLDAAFSGKKPDMASIRETLRASKLAANKKTKPTKAAGGQQGADVWGRLVSSASIEDEVKRIRLHYDSVVTTPGAFNGGGYQDARVDLTALATLFAVVSEYSGEIRWKSQAANARNVLARTAFNCKAGSTQVYNEAKLRKADLQELVSGSGFTGREAKQANQWDTIADRSPLMEYAETLIDSLEESSRDVASVKENGEDVLRQAELLAMLGEVLVQEGFDDAGDEDYDALSRSMSQASREVVSALARDDHEAARLGVSKIRSRCDACHEDYR